MTGHNPRGSPNGGINTGYHPCIPSHGMCSQVLRGVHEETNDVSFVYTCL